MFKKIIKLLFYAFVLFEILCIFKYGFTFLHTDFFRSVFYYVKPQYHYMVYIKPTYAIILFLLVFYITKLITKKAFYIAFGLCALHFILFFISSMSV